MKTQIRMLSNEMVSAPGMLRWGINGYHFLDDQPYLRNVFMAGWKLTARCADDLLSGRVPFTEEDGHAVFEYEEGKAMQVPRSERRKERESKEAAQANRNSLL